MRMGFFELLTMFVVVLVVWPVWRIFRKAGYPGLLSLLVFVPVVNLIMVYVFAFSEWPIESELRHLRRES